MLTRRTGLNREPQVTTGPAAHPPGKIPHDRSWALALARRSKRSWNRGDSVVGQRDRWRPPSLAITPALLTTPFLALPAGSVTLAGLPARPRPAPFLASPAGT